jgi:hypothetical protein
MSTMKVMIYKIILSVLFIYVFVIHLYNSVFELLNRSEFSGTILGGFLENDLPNLVVLFALLYCLLRVLKYKKA